MQEVYGEVETGPDLSGVSPYRIAGAPGRIYQTVVAEQVAVEHFRDLRTPFLWS